MNLYRFFKERIMPEGKPLANKPSYLRAKWTEVDEANPRTWRLAASTTDVRLSCSDPQNARIDQLVARMRQDVAWREVTALEITYESVMETLDWAADLAKLEYLSLNGKNLRDVQGLRRISGLRNLSVNLKQPPRTLADVLPCLKVQYLWVLVGKGWLAEAVGQVAGLTDLVIYGWPRDDLRELMQPVKRRLVVGQGKITSAQGVPGQGVRKLDVVYCRRFREFAPTQATWCDIAHCPYVDYTSLGRISGLRSLRIESQPPIYSVAWIRACELLYELTITATRLRADDLDQLAQLPDLTLVMVGLITRAQAQRLSQAKPGLVVTNSKFCYLNGESVDVQEAYYKAPRPDDLRRL